MLPKHKLGCTDFNGNGIYVDTDILFPCRLKRVLHRHLIRINRIDDRLERNTRFPCRPSRRRSFIGAHKPLGNRRAHELRREFAIVQPGNRAVVLDNRTVAHGVVRTRVVHCCVINDAVGCVFIGEVVRERIGKGSLRCVKRASRKNLRPRAAFINRVAALI